jgi:hypothetical protein
VDERRRQKNRFAPSAVPIHDDLSRPRLAEERHHRLGGRGRAEADDEIRQVGVAPRSRPHDLVATPDHEQSVVGSGPRPGERVGQDRKAGRDGQSGQCGRELRIVLRARDDEPSPRAPQAPASAATGRRGAETVRDVGEWHPDRSSIRGGGSTEVPVRDKRVAERQVEMDRPGRSIDGGCDGPAGDRADMRPRLRCPIEERYLGEPLRVTSVEANLVHRLWGAPVA